MRYNLEMENKKAYLNLKINPSIKMKLVEIAKNSNRSLTKVIEMLIMKSKDNI